MKISHIQHQASQQKVIVKKDTANQVINSKFSYQHYLNFTKGDFSDGDQKIKLKFLNLNKTIGIIFVLSFAQFHKLMGDILKQVQTWDTANPWQEKNITPVSSDTKGKTVY